MKNKVEFPNEFDVFGIFIFICGKYVLKKWNNVI
jgi:hypothetical protein